MRKSGDGFGGRPATRGRSNIAGKAASKPSSLTSSATDEDFYSSLAQMAGDDDNDEDEDSMTELDAKALASSLADMDDLDSDLFGNSLGKKSTPKPLKTPPANTQSKPEKSLGSNSARHQDVSSPKSNPSPSISKTAKAGKKFDISKYDSMGFDEDDPLAGLLSDDDDDGFSKQKPNKKQPIKKDQHLDPKKRDKQENTFDDAPSPKAIENIKGTGMTNTSQPSVTKPEPAAPKARPPVKNDLSFDSGDDLPGMDESPRIAPKQTTSKPPSKEKPKKKVDDLFGDDDDGLLGLDEGKQATPVAAKKQSTPSRFSELLGGKKEQSEEKLQKPKTIDDFLSNISSSKSPSQSSAKKAPPPKDDDFLFGDYTPSAVSTPPRGRSRPDTAPGSRRSVRFADDLGLNDDLFGADGRPATAPSSRNGAQNKNARGTGNSSPSKKEQETKSPVLSPRGNGGSDWLGLDSKDTGLELDLPTYKPTASSKGPQTPTSPARRRRQSTENDDFLKMLGIAADDKDSNQSSSVEGSPRRGRRWRDKSPEKTQDQPDFTSKPNEPKPIPESSGTPTSFMDGLKSQQASRLKKQNEDLSLENRKIHTGLDDNRDQQITNKDRQQQQQKQQQQMQQQQQQQQQELQQQQQNQHQLQQHQQQQQKQQQQQQQHQQPLKQQIKQQQQRMQQSVLEEPKAAGNQSLNQNIDSSQRDLVHRQGDAQTGSSSIPFKSPPTLPNNDITAQAPNSIATPQAQVYYSTPLSSQTQQSLLQKAQLESEVHHLMKKLHEMENSSQKHELDTTSHLAQLEAKVRRLELENEHLQSTLETQKSRHATETTNLEASHKAHVKTLEESYRLREVRIKEETELQASHYNDRIRALEDEKAALKASHTRKLASNDSSHASEVKRIKELHLQAIEEMRNENEEEIQRLRRLKEQEISAVSSAHGHTKSLQSLMQQVLNSTKDVNDMKSHIEATHKSSLTERELIAKARDEYLTQLQDRLTKQQAENDEERTRLQGLIAKMEINIREQNRQLDQEKWRLTQDESRIKSLQMSIEEERRITMEQLAADRADVQRARDELLREQKRVTSEIHEERRSLAMERAQISSTHREIITRQKHKTDSVIQAEADMEMTASKIKQETAALEERQAQLKEDESKLSREKRELNQRVEEFEKEKDRIGRLSLEVQRRSQEIGELCTEGARAREEGQEALLQAQRLRQETEDERAEIENRLIVLREKEKQLAEDRVSIAHERRLLEMDKRNSKSRHDRDNEQYTEVPEPSPAPILTTQDLDSSMSPRSKTPDILLNSLELKRNFRKWTNDKEKDEEFLEKESRFLKGLRKIRSDVGRRSIQYD